MELVVDLRKQIDLNDVQMVVKLLLSLFDPGYVPGELAKVQNEFLVEESVGYLLVALHEFFRALLDLKLVVFG